MRELKFNIHYLFQKKEFYFSIIGVLLLNLIACIMAISHDSIYNYTLEYVQSGEYHFILNNPWIDLSIVIPIVFPILCAMILSDSSFLDTRMGTDTMLKTRLNLQKNIVVRFLLSIIVTFFIAMVGFMLNYIVLRLLFGTGNFKTNFQDAPFFLRGDAKFFLDNLRATNPSLFVVSTSAFVSMALGLLSGLSYALSFITKQRVLIYFQVFVFLVLFNALIIFCELPMTPILKLLHPFNTFTLSQAIPTLSITAMISFILIGWNLRRKDILK